MQKKIEIPFDKSAQVKLLSGMSFLLLAALVLFFTADGDAFTRPMMLKALLGFCIAGSVFLLILAAKGMTKKHGIIIEENQITVDSILSSPKIYQWKDLGKIGINKEDDTIHIEQKAPSKNTKSRPSSKPAKDIIINTYNLQITTEELYNMLKNIKEVDEVTP